MEIVYCGGCGKVLRRDDFDRGLARTLDNRPWCSDCKPPDKDPIPTTSSSSRRQQGSSAKHPRLGTTRRESVVPAPSRTALIGIVVTAVAIVLLAFLFLGNSSAAPPATPEKLPKANVEAERNAGLRDEAQRLLKELETLASLAPPEKVLARCEELRPKFLRLPEEKRFLEIQAAAKEQRRNRDQESQFAREWEAVRKLIEEDLRFARGDEVERRLRALREIAGVRTPDVERLSADYKRDRQSSPHEKRQGPFFEDDQGFLRNWLVLGVFPNDKDKGIDVDFLKTETAAEPLSGQAVGNPKWAAYASPEAKIDFFRVPHLGIKRPKDNVVAYAFCVIQVPGQIAAEIRIGADDGAALWVDGSLVGKVHKPRILKMDEDRYAVPLAPGLHRILLKVDNHLNAYEFMLRILTADGRRVPGLKVWN